MALDADLSKQREADAAPRDDDDNAREALTPKVGFKGRPKPWIPSGLAPRKESARPRPAAALTRAG
jgi:hypothetical protein